MKYNLRSNVAATNPAARVRNIRSLPEPILDMNLGTVQRDSINIQKNCGPDNICIPDLHVSIKYVECAIFYDILRLTKLFTL